MPKQSKWSPVIPLSVLTALFCCFYYLLTPWHDSLYLVRDQFYQGAWWQLLSGQLMHHDAEHLWLNIAGLWVCWLVFPQVVAQWRFISLSVIFLMLGSSWIQLILGSPEAYYAGFSGTLYGMFTYAAWQDIRARHWTGIVVFNVVVAKVAYDFYTQAGVHPIAVAAHIGGITAALLLCLLNIGYNRHFFLSANKKP